MNDEAPSAAASQLKSRRDCAILGAKVFGGTMLASLAVGAAARVLFRVALGRFPDPLAAGLFGTALVIAVPPAAMFGAISGFELYRVAAGSREWRPIGCMVWILLFLLTAPIAFLIAPMLYLLYWRREQLLIEGANITWKLPAFYVALMLGMDAMRLSQYVNVDPLGKDLVFLSFTNGLMALCIADGIVVNVIARWRNEGRLAAPVSHTFQFTLGTMLIFVLSLGGWMTAMVAIFK